MENKINMEAITLDKILKEKGETSLSFIKVKVLLSKEVVKYTNKAGDAVMKEVTIADETSYTKAIAFDERKFPALVEGEAIIITNAIKKEDGTIIITSKTDIFVTSSDMVVVPDAVVKDATLQKTNDILTASLSPKKSVLSVKGKVVKTSTTVRKRLSSGEGEVNFKKLKIKDKTGLIEVGLWRDMAETSIKPGDHVELQNFYVSSRYDKMKKMNTPLVANQRKKSSIKFYTVDSDDVSSGCSDFEDEDVSKSIGNIIGIQQLHTYKACINNSCSYKKLDSHNKCVVCGVQYSTESAADGYVGKFLVQQDDRFSVLTFFTQALKELLTSLKISQQDNINKVIKEKLPLKIEYVADGDKIKTMQAVN
ncbi:uncharacterized protein LOC132714040 [Ruditapes philippinarum]|uniref:uncharacterized protein LOC132714040 n=1 Tax=Ruditapes philippinarum TaxID=129788 RepID=UPI00295A6438|nr:uncharacterized protein LOC132714040 [Ruditapes philippinarum]